MPLEGVLPAVPCRGGDEFLRKLFEPLGYAVATSLFLLVTTMYFNKGKMLMNVLTSVLYSFISYYAFTAWLGVNLPRGILPG